MLDQAFDKLKTLDWGSDPSDLKAIDDAISASHGDAATREQLETRLSEVLSSSGGRATKDFVFRRLMRIGSAASVPSLAKFLSDADLSHMARYALERIPAPEAAQALRDAVASVGSEQKVGVISSLGVRQDDDSVDMLGGLLGNSDGAVAKAAAQALGAIRSAAAAKALTAAKTNAEAASAATDALFACAESLVADGDKATAKDIYKRLAAGAKEKHVRLAATRGMLAAAGG